MNQMHDCNDAIFAIHRHHEIQGEIRDQHETLIDEFGNETTHGLSRYGQIKRYS